MKLTKLGLLILATVTFFSCLIYEQELNIFSDGSASLNISYSIDNKILTSLEELDKAAKNSKTKSTINYFDEKAIEEYLSSFPELKSHSVRVHKNKDRIHVNIKAEIDNLREALNAGLIPYARLSKNEENWRFTYSTPYDFQNITKDDSKKRIDQLEIKITINTPSDIIASSNEKFSKRSIKWNYSPDDNLKASSMPNSFFVEFSGEKISFE